MRMPEQSKANQRLEIAHVLFIDIVGYSTRLTDEQRGLIDRLNQAVRSWATGKGFKLFPKEGYGSITLNCFANNLGYDLAALNKTLKSKHGLVIDGGYGKLKGKTFRISNMGDETDATIAALLAALDSALAETPKLAS